MTTPSETERPTHDLPDHLVDLALSELIGGNTPPDLSSRIAATTLRQPAAVGQVSRTRQDRAFWVHLAIAVMLLIGITIVLLPTVRFSRAPANSVVANLTNSNDLNQSALADEKAKQSTKIVDLVEEFNRLNHEQRFAESEGVARRLIELEPNNPVAKQVWQNSKFIRREMLNTQLTDNKESSVWQQLNSVEESKINSGAAKADRLGDVANSTQSTVGTELYNPNDWKTRGATSNSTLATSPMQNPPSVKTKEASGRLGPEGTPQPKGLYAYLDVDSPAQTGLRPTGESLGADVSGPQQISGRPLVGGGSVETAKAQAPRAGFAFGDRFASTDDTLALSAGDGISHEALVGGEQTKRVTLGYEWKETAPVIRGMEPNVSGDKYTQIIENPFIKAEGGAAVSTFSIDVDTASYANVRQFLMQMNQLPPPDAVRIEELVNYFHYDYTGPKPTDEAPFAAHVELTACPWAPEHRLARIGIKGREMDRNKRPQSNLVFLVDVSGSMNEPAKLPLVIYGLEQLTHELGENDHIAIVVYAGTEGLVLPSTSGSKQDAILAALAKLQAGGSTAGGAGIQLAYQIAEENFIKGGTNRVILCTDGDFNVGVTNTADLQRLVEKKAKDTGVFISTLGFGRGNLNDAMMLAISDHGNGNYHYIDNRTEARRVLVEEMTGTLVTIAKDVKIQVEFNPAQVAGYRLIGYEKRALRTEDFNDDKKDAGEIGAGHTVTALYEIVPTGKPIGVAPVDPLKYQQPPTEVAGSNDKPTKSANASKELLTLKMRYKAPDGDTSKKLEWPVTDDGKAFAAASGDLKFAASVAGFGLLLRNSQYKGNLTYAAALELAQSGMGEDPHGYRKEFLDMIRKAKELRHE